MKAQTDIRDTATTWPQAVRLGALAGVVAPLLCGTVFVIAALLRPGYSSIRQYGSELALGRNGWLQTSNFIAVGVLLICFAVALDRGVSEGLGWKLGPVLVGVYGLGWVLVGVFHGQLHQWATDLFVALPFACLAISPRLVADGRWTGYGPLTLGCAVIASVLSAGWYVQHIQVLIPRIDIWIGLYQRLFYAEMLCWIEVMALRLFRLSFTSSAVGRRPAPAAEPPVAGAVGDPA